MNKVILMGRLARDPDIRHTQGEDSFTVARFTLAVDRRFKRNGAEQQADFISCIAFRQRAEFMEKYIHKGTKIVLTGSIQTGSYINKDGVKVYTTDVVAEDIEFAESKRAAAENGGGQTYGYDTGGAGGFDDNPSGGYSSGGAQSAPSPADDGFMNVPDAIDEELPFS
ncbi:MAG: single-stranded DNA-binding protein [Lachnospiraceae bacterium]|nr:single-stranded DNA-binding protein [Lachnospiraceae bacterium]